MLSMLSMLASACVVDTPRDAVGTTTLPLTIGGCDPPDRAQLFTDLEQLFEEAQQRGTGTNRFVIRFNRHYTPAFIGGTGFVLPTFTEGYGPEAVAEMVNALYRGLFGLEGEQDQLAFVASWVPDPLVGARVVELQQRHRGLDVEAGKLLLVLDEVNDIIQLVNRTIPDLESYAPSPSGEQNEIYYPADDACDRVMLAFRTSEAVTGGDEVTFRRASDGNIVSKVFVETNRTPGVMPPVVVGLAAKERVYPLAGLPDSLPPLADHRRVSLFPTTVLFSGDAQQKVAQMADVDTGLLGDIEALASEYSSLAPQLIDDLVAHCAPPYAPTISRVYGAPTPPSTDPFTRPGNGWGTDPWPSKYAVVKVTISGFDPARPPILEVLDAALEEQGAPASDALVERVWWRGTSTGQSTTIDLPVVIAGDPDPWDNPAKAGDPATRISRVRLLHCGQEVDSVKMELIKSTRWPGSPDIGVHVVPAVWHDMRKSQTDAAVLAIRDAVISNVYNAFFSAPAQTEEIQAQGGSYGVQKLIGQARMQIRLLEMKLSSVGGTSATSACCNSFNCQGEDRYMSWGGGLGDARGVDIYDLFVAEEFTTDCNPVPGGMTAKEWGTIILSRVGNKVPGEQPPLRSSARLPRIVAHELGHLLLLYGHSTDATNLMADPVVFGTPGPSLPQSSSDNQSIEFGRAHLSCAVMASPSCAGFPLPEAARGTPDNRYLQLHIQPAP